jgi:SAM-dependent methyltransferase
MTGSDPVRLRDAYPCLGDRLAQTPFDPHYFFQGAWLARQLARSGPTQHVDIGSSIMMLSVLSAHVPIVFVDYRPLRSSLPGIQSVGGDLLRLPFADATLMSVSSLHVIEHIGLGRYGDALNPEGSRLAAGELARVLRPGGRLFLSVPVGRQRVCFNAHRVFAPTTIVLLFASLKLRTFALVDDSGRFSEDIAFDGVGDLDYGCGMFEFVRPAPEQER